MKRRLDFADHRRALGANRYVYPVVSRRSKGLSIGVNLNPDKVCNFDCPYCQVDRTTPPTWRSVDLQILEDELDALLELAAGGHIWQHPPFDTAAPELRRINDIALAGDGEPTSFKGFGAVLEIVERLRDRYELGSVQPVVLTNATLLHRPRVQQGLRVLDRMDGRLWAKLDAGTEAYFQFVDGTQLPFSRILDNLAACLEQRPLVLQSMFLRLLGQGPSDGEIQAWLDVLEQLSSHGTIELVQVYSIARVPARPVLDMLPTPRLEEIAAGVRRLGIPAEVYAGRPTEDDG